MPNQKEIIIEIIRENQEQLPFALTPKDLYQRELLPFGLTKIYEMLERGEIPANKISGKWIIPRDQFLLWIYVTHDELINENIIPPLK